MKLYYNDEFFSSIINGFEALYEVDAVALGGSRSTGESDEKSDYDIYVYCTKELSTDKKAEIVKPYCSEAEIANCYWEPEDNCILKNGIGLDIIYRNPEIFENYLKVVVDGGKSFNGYTTCFWHNIIKSKVLFDKSGRFTETQKKYDIAFPPELKKNIIENNRKLLNGVLPSYDKQIEKAYSRGDIVSVHHRTTEFLASYFDIIFALNELTHPGEKRLVYLCKKYCKILPESFEENINALLSTVGRENPTPIIKDMIEKLDAVIV